MDAGKCRQSHHLVVTGVGSFGLPRRVSLAANERARVSVAPCTTGDRWRPPGPVDRGVRRRISRRPARTEPSAFLRVLQRIAPPSTSPRARAPAGSPPLRPGRANDRTCSDFAVSHRLAGLRHPRFRGLVASRYRPWGSSGFGPGARACLRGFRTSPPTPCPPELFLPRQPTAASPQRRAPLPFTALGRLDFEALIHRGVRGFTAPWPARRARGSPGLPYRSTTYPPPRVPPRDAPLETSDTRERRRPKLQPAAPRRPDPGKPGPQRFPPTDGRLRARRARRPRSALDRRRCRLALRLRAALLGRGSGRSERLPEAPLAAPKGQERYTPEDRRSAHRGSAQGCPAGRSEMLLVHGVETIRGGVGAINCTLSW